VRGDCARVVRLAEEATLKDDELLVGERESGARLEAGETTEGVAAAVDRCGSGDLTATPLGML